MNEQQQQTPDNREVIEGLVDLNFLIKLFRKSELTLLKWRQDRGLPYVEIPSSGENGRPAIRFREDKVREWARKQGHKVFPVDAATAVAAA